MQLKFFVLLLLSLCLISCPKRGLDKESYGEKRIIILPFMDLKDITLGDMDYYPFSNIERFTEDLLISGKPGREVASILSDLMQSKIKVIDIAEVKNKIIVVNFTNDRISQLMDNLEKECDYLLVGIVLRYIEREGGDFAASRPASFASEFIIFDIKSKKAVHRAFVEKTQSALFDDVTGIGDFVKAGGKWLTVKDLVILSLQKEVEKINVQ